MKNPNPYGNDSCCSFIGGELSKFLATPADVRTNPAMEQAGADEKDAYREALRMAALDVEVAVRTEIAIGVSETRNGELIEEAAFVISSRKSADEEKRLATIDLDGNITIAASAEEIVKALYLYLAIASGCYRPVKVTHLSKPLPSIDQVRAQP